MQHKPQSPGAQPYGWVLLLMGLIVGAQVALLQVALNRLNWGVYPAVFAPVVAVMGLSLLAWALFSQFGQKQR